MKGYWHIVSLSALTAIMSIVIDWNLIIPLLFWLGFLFTTNRLPFLPFILAIFSFLFFIFYLPSLPQVIDSEIAPSEHRTIEGEIIKPPIIQRERLEIILEDYKSGERVMVTYFPKEGEGSFIDRSNFAYGAECVANGEVEIPENARNPGEFDYQSYLLTQNVDKQMVIHDLNAVECDGSSFFERFLFLRNQLIDLSSDKVSNYTAGWINALVLGDDSLIDEEIITLFQDWGLSHILAISGLHIGIVVGLVYFLFIKTGLFTKEKTKLIIIFFLPVYAILAGSAPSVLRASMMVVFVLFLQRVRINLSGLDIISIVFLCLITLEPYYIYHIGFQFSFIVTCGIILSRKWLASISSPSIQVLIISFISQMVILPLQLNYFFMFQPLSISLNLLIIPYFSVFVIPFMFLILLFSFLPTWILDSFDLLFIGIHRQVIRFIEWVDHLFDYPLYLANLPLSYIIVYYILLILALLLIERRRLLEGAVSFIMLTILLIGYAAVPYFSEEGKVTMLDIGQGDAFIIELPKKSGTILIDAGARFSFEDFKATPSVYNRLIKPYLRSNGIYEIDALFLTHEDMDHIGSVELLMKDRLVKNIYISEYFELPDTMLEIGLEEGIPIERVKVGDKIEVGRQRFTVLGPLKDTKSVNENSLVLYGEIGGKRWLFTGDIGKEEELAILNHFDFEVDVLKIAHHGSNTSSHPEFIERVNADTALIPVGKDNSYGHPSIEVIETLEQLDVRIYRTDKDGAVTYKFRHEQGEFHTYLPN